MTPQQATVAIRVLKAISDRVAPDQSDVELLRSYLPYHSSVDPDELACEVIRQAIRRREKTSAKANTP
jgi:hypothetical protein